MDKKHRFTGPLFLVGMPRSGTKLLRDMLNQHPRVRFSPIETEFLPRWAAQLTDYGDIEDRERFGRFYNGCLTLPFFSENALRGTEVNCDEWYRTCEHFTVGGVFEALMKCVLQINADDERVIWGDKSPSYTRHVPLLFGYFPHAKIIHLVRDVRDYCLSVNRAWGKSEIRAAQRWNDDVLKCNADGNRKSESYMELRYEDLLLEPRSMLAKICDFIGVPFDEDMLSVGPGTETVGDAKGMSRVLNSNIKKYEVRMSQGLRTQIESIACAALRKMKYPCAYKGDPVRLPSWKMRLLQLTDGLGLVRASTAERGLIGALRLHIRHFRAAGST